MERKQANPPIPQASGVVLQGSRVFLRPKRVSDSLEDYAWRRDPELSRLDAASPLVASYKDYLANYLDEFNYPDPRKLYFAIDVDGVHVGNCLLFNLDRSKGQSEMGIMIGDCCYWNQGYGSDAVDTLLHYAFISLGLRRIYLYTLDWNLRGQRCFQKCGFKACRRERHEGSTFIIMEIFKKDWEEQRWKLATTQQKGPVLGPTGLA